MLNKIAVSLPQHRGVHYKILINEGILSEWHSWLPKHVPSKQVVIITDEVVGSLYAKAFANELIKNDYKVLLLVIVPGEESKKNTVKERLENEMLKAKYDKHSICLAFGGGVVGDLSGFIAATYMRGIKYMQIPTTLLAMVDSSVGGKTAINTPYGKNLIGAFWQPHKVVMDIHVLRTLPKVQLVNGLLEALKIYLTSDAKAFAYVGLYMNKILAGDYKRLQVLIQKAIRLKIAVVKADEREENVRMILNFGHTIGHAIEKLSNYQIPHGYAVGLGMLVEAKISQLMGYLKEDTYKQILLVFARLGVSISMLDICDPKDIIEQAYGDKKNNGGNIYCVLLKNIGSIVVHKEKVVIPVPVDYIYMAFNTLRDYENIYSSMSYPIK